jgi:hypothetical protein
MWKTMKKIIAGAESEAEIIRDKSASPKIEEIPEEETTKESTPMPKKNLRNSRK